MALIQGGADTADSMLALYLQNQGMICQIAKRYTGIAEFEDLAQEGYIGLCQAVDGYDPSQGIPFVSYAWKTIQRHLVRYIRGEKNLPEYLQILIGQYKGLTNAFLVRYGRKPTRTEYSYYLNIAREQLRAIEKGMQAEQQASLDALNGEDDATLADTVAGPDDVEGSVLDRVQQEQMAAIVWEVVDSLPEGQPAVIRKRYQENLTLQQTAEALGLSCLNEARRLEQKAIRRLRNRSRYRQLYSFEEILSEGMKGTGLETFKRTWTSATERAAIGC